MFTMTGYQRVQPLSEIEGRESGYHDDMTQDEGLELRIRPLSSVKDDAVGADDPGVAAVSTDIQRHIKYWEDPNIPLAS